MCPLNLASVAECVTAIGYCSVGVGCRADWLTWRSARLMPDKVENGPMQMPLRKSEKEYSDCPATVRI